MKALAQNQQTKIPEEFQKPNEKEIAISLL